MPRSTTRSRTAHKTALQILGGISDRENRLRREGKRVPQNNRSHSLFHQTKLNCRATSVTPSGLSDAASFFRSSRKEGTRRQRHVSIVDFQRDNFMTRDVILIGVMID
jgi:hypothetical protein